VYPDDLPLMQEAIDIARGPASDLDNLYRAQMPGGTIKYLHLVAHGMRNKDGRIEYIGAVQDVTQYRLSEDTLGKVRSELAHVARVTSLGVLTASIAHEVNQPLATIVTNATTCLRMLGAEPPNLEGARDHPSHDARWTSSGRGHCPTAHALRTHRRDAGAIRFERSDARSDRAFVQRIAKERRHAAGRPRAESSARRR
jgi:signal transduction histidine kinase